MKTTHGLFNAVRDTAAQISAGLSKAVDGYLDAFYGVDVRASAHVARGTGYVYSHRGKDGRRTAYIHPLDVLYIDYVGEPTAHLEEALDWIADRTNRELDQVLDRAQEAADRGRVAQEVRMAAWMREHGVTRNRLAAAKALVVHNGTCGNEHRQLTLDELTEALTSAEEQRQTW